MSYGPEGRKWQEDDDNALLPNDESADSAWRKLNVLSLDGGGIRGYWSLLALEWLMQHIARIEEEEDENIHHSFSPQAWPDNVSQIPLTVEEKRQWEQTHNGEARVRILHGTRRYLPCHYFDYICGSSTGSIIAIMLGRFRMTVPDCLDEYQNLGQEVFGRPRIFHTLRFGVGERYKYNATRLEKVCKDVCKRRNEQPEQAHGKIFFPSAQGLCKTFVTTRQRDEEGGVDMLYLIRSYDHNKRAPPDNSTKPTPRSTMRSNTQTTIGSTSRSTMGPSRANTGTSRFGVREPRKTKSMVDVNYEPAQNFEVWEVARAATAAPLYFEPMKIESALPDDYILFTDGGFSESNNPVRDAKREIEKLHGDTSIGIIVSVGTARKDLRLRKKAFLSTVPRLAKQSTEMATNPESNHVDMQREYESFSNDRRNFRYYRLNHPGGLQTELDEWNPKKNRFSSKAAGSKTIATITNKFNAWAKDTENQEVVQACAAELVARRRLRKDTPRWERYATGAQYECRETGCTTYCGHFNRGEFVRHLRFSHRELDEEEVKDRELHWKKDWCYQRAREPTRS